MFKNGFGGVTAADGVQWAELNAYSAARLYQTVCLMEGDVVEWYLYHKARGSSAPEEMKFNIGESPTGVGSTTIVQGQTNNAGVGTVVDCHGECSVTTENGWARYSGRFSWDQPTGLQTIGFEAVSGANMGNFLDNIAVFGVTPIVELDSSEAKGFEGEHTAANFPIGVRVSGNIPEDEPLVVEVAIVPITADASDVSPGESVFIEIPPGDYAGESFPIPLDVLTDDLPEDEEQFRLEIVDKPGKGGYRIGSVNACGEAGLSAATYTILDSHLSFEKTGTFVDLGGGFGPDGTPIKNAGDRMDYVFTVVNTGSIDLADIVVSDTVIGTPTLDPTQSDIGTDGRLPPKGKAVFLASYTLTQEDIDRGEITNLATVTAIRPDYPDRPPLTATSSHTEPLPHVSSISIQKTGSFDPETDDGDGLPDPGERLRFDIAVSNDGNTTVFDVRPNDTGPSFDGMPGSGVMGAFSPESADILPGTTQIFTAYYTLSSEDILVASGITDGVTNEASVTGRTPTGETLTVETPGPVPMTMPGFAVEKKAGVTQTHRGGGTVPYTITLKPLGLVQTTRIRLADIIPAGFVYIPNTATIDGVPTEPSVQGRRHTWEIDVEPEKNVEIGMVLGASAATGFGVFRNIAQAERTDIDLVYRQKGVADVEIIPEPLFDCGDIIGKVFNDTNRNGYQDPDEDGVPGVRVVGVDGLLVTTDEHGRFNVACASLPNRRLGSNHVLKLDPRSLPTGYRIISENPRVVRLTPGKASEVNFAVSIARVVRLDIGAPAFSSGAATLSPEWEKRILALIQTLEAEPSVLRIVHSDQTGDRTLANQRLKYLRGLIAQHWKERSNRYRLEIESLIQVGGGT